MLRSALHITASTVLWVVFLYYWRIVVRQPMNPDTRTALVILAVLTAFAVVCLTAWIYHNLRIYRRSDRRRRRRSAARTVESDHLGRLLVFERPEEIERSNYVEVEMKEGFVGGRWVERKVFKPRAENGVKF